MRRRASSMRGAVTPSWLDTAISAISPQWGFKRLQYKQAATMLSSYRGAEHSRLREDWLGAGGSADAELLDDLPTLRDRSRDLDKNDPWARSVYNTIAVNAIGTGLVPQSRVTPKEVDADVEEVRAFQRAAERVWREHMPMLDAQWRVDGMVKQRLLFRSVIQSGEVLDIPLRKPLGHGRFLELCTETVEADRLRTPSYLSSERQARTRDGVELDATGTPIMYHVLKRHPGDQLLRGAIQHSGLLPEDFVSYDARNALGKPNVYHLFWPLRPGQSRGEPWLAPALSLFKDLGDFMEAKIVAERVGACFGVAIEKLDPTGAISGLQNNTAGQPLQELEPGMMPYLNPGEKIAAFTPDLKGTDLDKFVEVFVKLIGAAVGLPYELITKDFTKTTWHSARASLLETGRFFKCYQQWFAASYLQPLWEMVQLEAWSRGLLPNVDLLGPNGHAWLRTRWVPPGRGYIDPVREVKASVEAIQGRLSTESDELAAQGRDYEEVYEQLAREAELRKELGLDEAHEETPSPTDPNLLPDDIHQQVEDIVGVT